MIQPELKVNLRLPFLESFSPSQASPVFQTCFMISSASPSHLASSHHRSSFSAPSPSSPLYSSAHLQCSSVFTALFFSSSTLISSLLHLLLRQQIQLFSFCSILPVCLPLLLPSFSFIFCSVLATVSRAPVLNSLSTVLRSGSIVPPLITPPIHHLHAVSCITP